MKVRLSMNFKDLRIWKNWTQVRAASDLGVSRRTVEEWEKKGYPRTTEKLISLYLDYQKYKLEEYQFKLDELKKEIEKM